MNLNNHYAQTSSLNIYNHYPQAIHCQTAGPLFGLYSTKRYSSELVRKYYSGPDHRPSVHLEADIKYVVVLTLPSPH
jgi:hypothetical protein